MGKKVNAVFFIYSCRKGTYVAGRVSARHASHPRAGRSIEYLQMRRARGFTEPGALSALFCRAGLSVIMCINNRLGFVQGWVQRI